MRRRGWLYVAMLACLCGYSLTALVCLVAYVGTFGDKGK